MKTKRGGIGRAVISCLIIVVVLLVGYAVVFGMAREKSRYVERLETRLSSETRLALLNRTFRDVLYIKNAKKFFMVPIPTSELLFAIKYDAIIGLDLSKGFSLRYSSVEREVVVTYDRPVVLDVAPDYDSIENYFTRGSLFRNVKDVDFMPAIADERIKISALAASDGALDAAGESARLFFRSYLAAKGFSRVRFVENPAS